MDLADDIPSGSDTKWRARISSGFDRLVAFASTELDKRRRSSEEVVSGAETLSGSSHHQIADDVTPAADTSPDSGIGNYLF